MSRSIIMYLYSRCHEHQSTHIVKNVFHPIFLEIKFDICVLVNMHLYRIEFIRCAPHLLRISRRCLHLIWLCLYTHNKRRNWIFRRICGDTEECLLPFTCYRLVGFFFLLFGWKQLKIWTNKNTNNIELRLASYNTFLSC